MSLKGKMDIILLFGLTGTVFVSCNIQFQAVLLLSQYVEQDNYGEPNHLSGSPFMLVF